MMRFVSAAFALALAACTSAPNDGGHAASSASAVRIGEEVRLGGFAVRALRLVEDSRCPQGVQCIQAGTVRLAVRLKESGGDRETVLRLGEPEAIGAGRFLRLSAVCPRPGAPGSAPPPHAYRFSLSVGADMAATSNDPRC